MLQMSLYGILSHVVMVLKTMFPFTDYSKIDREPNYFRISRKPVSRDNDRRTDQPRLVPSHPSPLDFSVTSIT